MRWFPRALLVLGLAAAGAGCAQSDTAASADMPLDRLFTTVADVPVGAKTGRFDYLSFDPESGRLFVSKMGSGKLLVFDSRNQTFVAELDGFPKVTGVLAVPALHRVYASVPGAGIGASVSAALGVAGLSSGSGAVAILDSDTLKEIARVPGGVFPDGIAYDPDDGKIFVSDELGGAIEIIDARTNKPVARIDAGGEVGNVQYDRTTKLVFAPVQSKDELAIVDPKSDRLVGRFPLPGSEHPHGLRIAADMGIAYVACDGNDRLLVVDLKGRTVLGTQPLGHDPDVLADDPGLKRLYVAGESGILSVFDIADPARPRAIGRVFAGENAHSVAVDPATHRLFLPLRNLNGRAVMRIIAPTDNR
ncbi:MAG TPA: YncE family protein [Alphaproteobacteria bacterium]|nr:YncE family protein [Alphaproteobacteria bacterium]